MQDTHKKHNSGNGFVLGLIIGGAVATMLSTKRGRALIRDMAEMGLEALDNFLEEETVGEFQEEINEEPSVMPPPLVDAGSSQVEEIEAETNTNPVVDTPIETPKAKKKFFKGLRKK